MNKPWQETPGQGFSSLHTAARHGELAKRDISSSGAGAASLMAWYGAAQREGSSARRRRATGARSTAERGHPRPQIEAMINRRPGAARASYIGPGGRSERLAIVPARFSSGLAGGALTAPASVACRN